MQDGGVCAEDLVDPLFHPLHKVGLPCDSNFCSAMGVSPHIMQVALEKDLIEGDCCVGETERGPADFVKLVGHDVPVSQEEGILLVTVGPLE